jgi:hypothetical protein
MRSVEPEMNFATWRGDRQVFIWYSLVEVTSEHCLECYIQ